MSPKARGRAPPPQVHAHGNSIVAWNANSLRAVGGHRLDLQQYLYRHRPLAVAVSETHLSACHSLHLPHYVTHRADFRTGCSGVALLLRRDLTITSPPESVCVEYSQPSTTAAIFVSVSVRLPAPVCRRLRVIACTYPPIRPLTSKPVS